MSEPQTAAEMADWLEKLIFTDELLGLLGESELEHIRAIARYLRTVPSMEARREALRLASAASLQGSAGIARSVAWPKQIDGAVSPDWYRGADAVADALYEESCRALGIESGDDAARRAIALLGLEAREP